MKAAVFCPDNHREPAVPRAHVDASRWPDVATVPHSSPLRAGVAAWVVRRALGRLPLRVQLGGAPLTGDEGFVVRVRDPHAFFRRLGADGLIGFGESYMAREWETDDLVGVLTVLAAHVSSLVPRPLQVLRGLWAHRHPAGERNSPSGARANIQRHYDLSNDLFGLFLDETMTYSAAVFRGFPASWPVLADAQRRKIDRLLDLAEVTHGTRLLEIGTGWGELALRAADRGAHVTTVTLSREQRDFAAARIEEAGHTGHVSVELCDYREVRGEFDAIVSVEMIEAVGEEYWPVYFDTLARLLAPGGRVALQAITMAHERMQATRDTYTWIHKYIFPGGLIPSAEAMSQAAAPAGLAIVRDDAFGPHYAETLRLWRERFIARADDVERLGFDATFIRMWEFYLAYCEAGFSARYLDVHHMVLAQAGAR
ncbi:class I SAM-dependent methyltransferase [Streptomyces sp. NPDC001691]|uniref:SAM-dependent methyltransferase n=1 Tax=unclassified Streptomyces TaxID=2593676 RepID=UPI00167264D9|nr:cyclopropane-fatty-acyl-phospholipid synthase family protein [Streptomyces sp. SDr-06]